MSCRLENSGADYLVRIRANRFVYGMCRSIVGAMMSVARGKSELGQIKDALQGRDRELQPGLAPPHGLVLNRVHYASGLFDDHNHF